MISDALSRRRGYLRRLVSRESARFFGVVMALTMLPAVSYCALPGEVILPGTQTFTLKSSETGRDYLIEVSIPKAPPPSEGYPVVYLLDGNAYLPLMQMARDTLTGGNPQQPGNPLLIVAIGYPDTVRFAYRKRAADYTPPVAERNEAKGEHGGADRFLVFINDSLKPVIAKRYSVNQSQETLFGHSFGGLFVVHTLLTAPASFERYIAISPSLWWYGDKPLEVLSGQALPAQTIKPAPRILMGVGELEQTPDNSGRDTPKAKVKKGRAMIDNTSAMADWLRLRYPGWHIQFELFSGENHGSVMWPATRSALEFLQQNSSDSASQ